MFLFFFDEEERDDVDFLEIGEVPSTIKTDGFTPELADQFKNIILNCYRWNDNPTNFAANIEVVGYRFTYNWDYRGTTDYSVMIRAEDDQGRVIGHWIPVVHIGPQEKEIGQMIFFHKARWSDLDWYITKYTFRSQEDFDILWNHHMRGCPEMLRHLVKSRPGRKERTG